MPPTARTTFVLRRLWLAVVPLILPAPVLAFTFTFPAPTTQSFEHQVALTSYALPIGPFAKGVMQTERLEGAVMQSAWSMPAKGLTTLQILAPLRDQLKAAGFTVLYDCDTAACGGFDFRFGTDIAPEPAMHVDLGDFHYLAAKRAGPTGPEHIALIVSRSSTLGFVQLTQISAGQMAPVPAVAPTAPAIDPPIPTSDTTPMGEGLEKQGSVSLDDLIFASGAADLAPGDYASLDALAAYLQAHPDSAVTLVGHTDASGGLAGNIALSRARAGSVRIKMIDSYAIPANQISAEGVGYLAPRDSNLTEQGLTRNRRVEVMLLVKP